MSDMLTRCFKAQADSEAGSWVWIEQSCAPPYHPENECRAFSDIPERQRAVLGPNLVLWTGRAHVLMLEIKPDG